jgi:hypothetical protein
MGQYTRPSTTITDFKPDDTDTVMYLNCNYITFTLSEIHEKCKEKWGADIQMEDISITSEYIHTRCLGYDLYDSSDYENFLVLSYDPTV